MTEFRVCLITVPTREAGEELARSLLQARLAACVNIVPGCQSLYWWEGAICNDAEVLLIAKSDAARLEALVAHVLAHHPYSCPEVLALPVAAGSLGYLDWLGKSLAPSLEGESVHNPSGSG